MPFRSTSLRRRMYSASRCPQGIPNRLCRERAVFTFGGERDAVFSAMAVMTASGQNLLLPHRNSNGRFASISGHNVGSLIFQSLPNGCVAISDATLESRNSRWSDRADWRDYCPNAFSTRYALCSAKPLEQCAEEQHNAAALRAAAASELIYINALVDLQCEFANAKGGS
jgi:hypothetical protein